MARVLIVDDEPKIRELIAKYALYDGHTVVQAENGMEERKSLARKLGEEAGTKLLLPMMLMLILVVVILMVPAVLAF